MGLFKKSVSEQGNRRVGVESERDRFPGVKPLVLLDRCSLKVTSLPLVHRAV